MRRFLKYFACVLIISMIAVASVPQQYMWPVVRWIHAADITSLNVYTGKIGQEDVEWGTGRTTDTFTAQTPSGGIVTLTKLPSLAANVASLIKGRWHVSTSGVTDHGNGSQVGSIKWVLNILAGSSAVIEAPPGTYAVGTAMLSGNAIPAGVTLMLHPGAQLAVNENMEILGKIFSLGGNTAHFNIATGKTLALSSSSSGIRASSGPLFTGNGSLSFGAGFVFRTSWFDSLSAAALKLTGSFRVTLIVDKSETLTGAVTIPSNVLLRWESTNLITTGGYALTIPALDAPPIQLFSGSGVQFLDGFAPSAYVEWWGDGGTSWQNQIRYAVSALPADRGGIIDFLPRTYQIDADLEINETADKTKHIFLRGGAAGGSASSYGTRIYRSGTAGYLLRIGIDDAIAGISGWSANLEIDRISFVGDGASNIVGIGVYKSKLKVRHCTFDSLYSGIDGDYDHYGGTNQVIPVIEDCNFTGTFGAAGHAMSFGAPNGGTIRGVYLNSASTLAYGIKTKNGVGFRISGVTSLTIPAYGIFYLESGQSYSVSDWYAQSGAGDSASNYAVYTSGSTSGKMSGFYLLLGTVNKSAFNLQTYTLGTVEDGVLIRNTSAGLYDFVVNSSFVSLSKIYIMDAGYVARDPVINHTNGRFGSKADKNMGLASWNFLALPKSSDANVDQFKVDKDGGIHTASILTGISNSITTGAATYTLTPTALYTRLTCYSGGTTVTMGESGIVDGQIAIVSNAGTETCTFADTSGVSELATGFVMGQYDSLMLIYASDRWVELSRSNN